MGPTKGAKSKGVSEYESTLFARRPEEDTKHTPSCSRYGAERAHLRSISSSVIPNNRSRSRCGGNESHLLSPASASNQQNHFSLFSGSFRKIDFSLKKGGDVSRGGNDVIRGGNGVRRRDSDVSRRASVDRWQHEADVGTEFMAHRSDSTKSSMTREESLKHKHLGRRSGGGRGTPATGGGISLRPTSSFHSLRASFVNSKAWRAGASTPGPTNDVMAMTSFSAPILPTSYSSPSPPFYVKPRDVWEAAEQDKLATWQSWRSFLEEATSKGCANKGVNDLSVPLTMDGINLFFLKPSPSNQPPTGRVSDKLGRTRSGPLIPGKLEIPDWDPCSMLEAIPGSTNGLLTSASTPGTKGGGRGPSLVFIEPLDLRMRRSLTP